MGCLTLKVTKVVPDEKSTPVESEQKKGGCKLQDGGKVLEGQKERVSQHLYLLLPPPHSPPHFRIGEKLQKESCCHFVAGVPGHLSRGSSYRLNSTRLWAGGTELLQRKAFGTNFLETRSLQSLCLKKSGMTLTAVWCFRG